MGSWRCGASHSAETTGNVGQRLPAPGALPHVDQAEPLAALSAFCTSWRCGGAFQPGSASPAAIAGAGNTAVRRFLEFFAATIRNKNTRMAYYRAVTDFFAWLDGRHWDACLTSHWHGG
jgi:hypothetical protein